MKASSPEPNTLLKRAIRMGGCQIVRNETGGINPIQLAKRASNRLTVVACQLLPIRYANGGPALLAPHFRRIASTA